MPCIYRRFREVELIKPNLLRGGGGGLSGGIQGHHQALAGVSHHICEREVLLFGGGEGGMVHGSERCYSQAKQSVFTNHSNQSIHQLTIYQNSLVWGDTFMREMSCTRWIVLCEENLHMVP